MNDGCYDLDGNPLSMEQWMDYRIALQDEPGEPWRVGHEEFDDGYTVSTVWIGTDHHDPPRIWETMIFADGTPELQVRWETREQAQTGHDAFAKVMRDPRLRQRYREVVPEFTVD